jgi:hypothetical protein
MSRRKKKTLRLPAILIGFIMIGGAFVFSLRSLTNPNLSQNMYAYEKNSEMTKEEFISRLLPHAKELQEGYGILPSIVIGQAILESNWGNSQLSKEYNNLFGIKAYGDQNKVTLDTVIFVFIILGKSQWMTIPCCLSTGWIGVLKNMKKF